jgi:hypothetical protein
MSRGFMRRAWDVLIPAHPGKAVPPKHAGIPPDLPLINFDMDKEEKKPD